MTMSPAVPTWPFDAKTSEASRAAGGAGVEGSGDSLDAQRLLRAITDAQGGSAQGFEIILELYGRRLYGFFYRATGNGHEAEDLVSELMLRLIRRLKHYQHRDRFESWLFRIAANMARDRIRSLRSRPTILSLSYDKDGEQGDREHPCRQGEPLDGRLVEAERSGHLQALLDQLDPTTRGMILLRYFGDMSYSELAKTFQCPLGTALAKVHRGLQFLRQRADRLADERPDAGRESVSVPAPSRRRREKKAPEQVLPYPA
ncbi:MAG: RNA polymerase sigma factor [Planctomycetota bacterium]